MEGDLAVFPIGTQYRHRPDCTFGPGFFKIVYLSGGLERTYYAQSRGECDAIAALLTPVQRPRFYRDACLDHQDKRLGDSNTPDTVDADWWLGLDRQQAMEELGLDDETEYAKVYQQVYDVACTRDNRTSQSGVRASIIIKRKRRKSNEKLFIGGHLARIGSLRR